MNTETHPHTSTSWSRSMRVLFVHDKVHWVGSKLRKTAWILIKSECDWTIRSHIELYRAPYFVHLIVYSRILSKLVISYPMNTKKWIKSRETQRQTTIICKIRSFAKCTHSKHNPYRIDSLVSGVESIEAFGQIGGWIEIGRWMHL